MRPERSRQSRYSKANMLGTMNSKLAAVGTALALSVFSEEAFSECEAISRRLIGADLEGTPTYGPEIRRHSTFNDQPHAIQIDSVSGSSSGLPNQHAEVSIWKGKIVGIFLSWLPQSEVDAEKLIRRLSSIVDDKTLAVAKESVGAYRVACNNPKLSIVFNKTKIVEGAANNKKMAFFLMISSPEYQEW